MILNKEPYISSGGWITLNEYVDYKVVSGIVFVKIKKTEASSTWTEIATIPLGFRPSVNIYNTIFERTSDRMNVYVNSLGSVQIFGDTSGVLSSILSYPLD